MERRRDGRGEALLLARPASFPRTYTHTYKTVPKISHLPPCASHTVYFFVWPWKSSQDVCTVDVNDTQNPPDEGRGALHAILHLEKIHLILNTFFCLWPPVKYQSFNSVCVKANCRHNSHVWTVIKQAAINLSPGGFRLEMEKKKKEFLLLLGAIIKPSGFRNVLMGCLIQGLVDEIFVCP